MTNLDDSTEGGYTASSPEEFEQWFNSLPTEEQKAFMDRVTRLSKPTEYITTDQLADELAKDCPNPDCICKQAEDE